MKFKVENTKYFVKYLYRFICPKCDTCSFDAKFMQDHLLWCKKDYIVEKEVRKEIDEITILSESSNDENEYGQSSTETIEDTKGPKIDSVLSYEEALAFRALAYHENKVTESPVQEEESLINPDLNSNQRNKANYVRPLVKQENGKPFVCNWPNCGKKFRSRVCQLIHYQKHNGVTQEHNGSKKPFACTWANCQKKFKSESDRTVHYRTHTGERPFVCDWPNCGKKFRSRKQKLTHYQKHNGELPFACTWANCEKKFKSRRHRDMHFSLHTDESPYVCGWENCSKKFSLKGNRDKHFRTHTGEKQYACEWENCNRTFFQKSNRDCHYATHSNTRTHTGEKPYICDWKNCTKRFAYKGSFIRHSKKHFHTVFM